MTAIDDAMDCIRSFCLFAGIDPDRMPSVLVTFRDPADQAKFKIAFVKSMVPSDVVTAPIAGRAFEVQGIMVEIANRDRGPRAEAARIIKQADEALKACEGRRITPEAIAVLREASKELLFLVKGN